MRTLAIAYVAVLLALIGIIVLAIARGLAPVAATPAPTVTAPMAAALAWAECVVVTDGAGLAECDREHNAPAEWRIRCDAAAMECTVSIRREA